jgi:hypothetical protein
MFSDSRKCLVCGKSMKGRADKKYCDNLCRNVFNNRKYFEEKHCVGQINNKLRRNRRILSEFFISENERVITDRNELLERGFNFTYMTRQYRTKEGDIYVYCYDFGYLQLDNQQFLLVKTPPVE